jgi:dihydroneopterin aldolase
MDKLILEGLEFYAYHGYFPEEQKIGGNYCVYLEAGTDLRKAVASDLLEDTPDYGKLYELVQTEMATPSKLIEHLAGRIIARIFEVFRTIDYVKIRISKLNPPLSGKAYAATVELERRRNI